MNRQDMIAIVAKQCRAPTGVAAQAVDVLLERAACEIEAGNDVSLPGIGAATIQTPPVRFDGSSLCAGSPLLRASTFQ